MRKFMLVGLMAGALVLGATPAINAKKNVSEENDARIVVKFSRKVDDLSREQVINYQNNALHEIKNYIAPSLKVVNRYTTILNGVVLNVPSSKVNDIRNLDFVSAVDYDTMHNIEEKDGGITIRLANNENVVDDNISAQTMNVPSDTKKGEGVLIGILDSGFLLNHYDEATHATYTHETFTALDASIKTKYSSASEINAKVATEGFHGKAETVDSLYFNSKVPYYYDYGGEVHNRDDYGEVITPDNDVFSPLSDHGLHVASMAAGNGPTYKGIAENAQLALFKVFTEYYPSDEEKKTYNQSTGCFDSAVLSALEDAAILGCNVLNMSFGSDLNDFDEDSIVQNLLKQLQAQGIWSNFSAGNSGKGYYNGTAYGGWSTEMVDTGILSHYSNNEGVMTIAANQADKEYYTQALVVDGNYISYTDQVVSNSSTTYDPDRHLSDVLSAGNDVTWVKVPNFGEAADYNGLNVAGKVAIVNRGSNTFVEKVSLATSNGAVAICIINNSSESVRMSFGEDSEGKTVTPSIPVALIAYEDKDKFVSDSGILALIENVYVDNITARQMATFSSDGATFDYRIKPEITAPGHLVKGAVSENEAGEIVGTATGSYDYWSGTSMSAPNYTGAVALLLGEHTNLVGDKLVVDSNYIKTVNARTMSTADQMNDKNGLDASVRIQGAGMVNVRGALNSEVYLEKAPNAGKAKIELQNNEDIANGIIKLSFTANNEGQAKTYNAKVKVYRPSIYRYERNDSSKEDASLNNIELQGIENTLIKEVDVQVNIPAGQSTVTLDPIVLSEAEKAYIDEHFPYACAIEGYVVLTNNKDARLSIPFMGYYGDVSSAPAIEPFNFEKDPGKVYQSASVNGIMDIMGFETGDFSSEMVNGYFNADFFSEDDDDEDSGESPLTNWLYNKAPITGIKGSNGASMMPVNATKGSDGKYNIYTANNSKCNTIIIQQFVMRSVADNVLTITKKSNNEVVLTDHMFDTLWGTEDKYYLGKSFCLDDYLSNGIIGHRAYTILGLFADKNFDNPYPDGEYSLDFDYTLTDGSHQRLSYNLVITNASPTIKSITYNDDSIRIRFADYYLTSVTLAGKTVINPMKDAEGYYVDIKQNDSNIKNGRLFFSAKNGIGANVYALTHTNDGHNLTVANASLGTTHNFTVAKTEGEGVDSYVLSFTKNNRATTLSGNIYVTIKVPDGKAASDLTVLDYDASDVAQSVTFENNGGCITFQTNHGKFDIQYGTDKAPTSISVVGPDRLIYATGADLDLSGLVVKAVYENGDAREVTDYTVGSVDMTSAGNKTVTVSYNDLSASFNIEVINKAIVSEEIVSLPNKTVYNINDAALDLTGLKLMATYNDGSVGEISSYAVSNVDLTTPGAKIVTVTDEANNISSSFTITVLRAYVESIVVTSNNKLEYHLGDNFDFSSLVVTATLSDGTTMVINDYRVMNFDSSKVGEYTLTINVGGKVATTTITILPDDIGPGPGGDDSSSSIPPEPSSSEAPSSSSSQAPSTSAPASDSSEPAPSSAPDGSSSESGRAKKGCGGDIISATSIVMAFALLGAVAIFSKKKFVK